MGSVIDYTQCPNCKTEDAYTEFWYKSGEEMINCTKCGYYRSSFIVRDEEGKAIKIDKDKDFSFDNIEWKDIHIEKPYCSFHVEHKTGIGQIATLESKKELDKILADNDWKKQKVRKVTYSRLFRGKIKETIVWKK